MTDDPIDLQAVIKARDERVERAQLAEQQEIDDIRRLMTDAAFRRFVRRFLDSAGVFRLSYTSDALAMAFAEGRRNEGLRLLDLLVTHCPENYVDLILKRHE